MDGPSLGGELVTPASPEVAAHELTVELIEQGTRALVAGGRYLERERTIPWWRPFERRARARESAAVLAVIGYMLGDGRLPDA